MDWVDEESRAPGAREGSDEGWREPRAEGRPGKKGLENRLDGLVNRPTPPARNGERPGGVGRGRLESVGRWVEGTLDWLLDDRDDWREPWQEGERPGPGLDPPAPSRTRPPLEAISRRGTPSAPRPTPLRPESTVPSRPGQGSDTDGPPLEWPEEDTFTVPRWRREEPPPQKPIDPLAPAPASAPPPPGRPLPRSTRRR
ncbi:MAG: hypothetical protein VKP70_01270 [Cyanobacteriota bacterium]|nr:hypothetical protein [Cyanobacteriota bacterium]